jgi:hypothetical protein
MLQMKKMDIARASGNSELPGELLEVRRSPLFDRSPRQPRAVDAILEPLGGLVLVLSPLHPMRPHAPEQEAQARCARQEQHDQESPFGLPLALCDRIEQDRLR